MNHQGKTNESYRIKDGDLTDSTCLVAAGRFLGTQTSKVKENHHITRLVVFEVCSSLLHIYLLLKVLTTYVNFCFKHNKCFKSVV